MFMYFNVCSVLAHLSEVRELLKTRSPVALFLSETHLTEEIDDFEVYCTGYNMERCDSNSRHTEGVMVYVRQDIKFNVVTKYNQLNNFWILKIQMYERIFKGSLSVLYRSPSQSIKDFFKYFSECCDEFTDIGINNIVEISISI